MDVELEVGNIIIAQTPDKQIFKTSALNCNDMRNHSKGSGGFPTTEFD